MNKQQYLLICLMEELGEVQKAISKAIRFGLDDVYEGQSTLQIIREEFGDVSTILDMLLDGGIELQLDYGFVHEYAVKKEARLKKWMEYSKECGVLDE